jgi:hypothetical protein
MKRFLFGTIPRITLFAGFALPGAAGPAWPPARAEKLPRWRGFNFVRLPMDYRA